MNTKISFQRLTAQWTVLALLSLSAGCATQAMKGTPFYTGEWTERTGNAEDRVALWPFVYYRSPALSVLWPIFEKSPDHFAMRPIYSVRGLSQDHRVHHLLWPLGRFDPGNDQYRFFPIFAGDDYFVIFPILWHFENPFLGNNGSNALFPLWIYMKRPALDTTPRKILHVAWPFARFEAGPRVDSARIFPLFSAYKDGDGKKTFTSLPFGYLRDEQRKMQADWLLPLYIRKESPKNNFFYTIPYGYRETTNTQDQYVLLGLWKHHKGPDSSHHWLLPFYAYHKTMDTSLLALPLALSWKRTSKDHTDWHILGPVGRLSKGDDSRASYLFPFVYSDPASGTFLSPLFQKGANPANHSNWHAIAPIYLHKQSPTSSAWITPLGAITRDADGGRRTITPLYANIQQGTNSSFRAIPPLLSWQIRHNGQTDNWLALGIARFGWGTTNTPSHLLPIYYRNPNVDALVTPLWATWKTGKRQYHAIPPLLSWHATSSKAETSTRILGGIAARDTKPDGSHARSHIFPLYRADTSKDLIMSLLYARWTSPLGERQEVIPPMLCWRTTDQNDNRSIRLAAGLYGHTRRPNGTMRNSYMFPLYTHWSDRYFYTPLIGRDAPDHGNYQYWLTPLLGTYRNELTGSWIWPIYKYRRDRNSGYHDSRFMLWGRHTTDKNTSRTSLFPVFSRHTFATDTIPATDDLPEPEIKPYARRKITNNSLSILLFYHQQQTLTRYGPKVAPVIHGETYTSLKTTSNRLFPLWHFKRESYGLANDGPSQTTGSLLWRLYDHKSEHGTPEHPHEYVRRRILWHAWHYERLNGAVSVDSLPFITYDTKPDGFRKFTFLWRAFRYENHPAQGRKLDLLFIPLLRSKASRNSPVVLEQQQRLQCQEST